MSMNVVVPRWGSTGDVVPTIAVGAELRRRGHRVTFVGNPYFEPLAVEAGLGFRPVGTLDQHRRLMDDVDLFDRTKKDAGQAIADHYAATVEGFYETVSEVAAGSAVIVGGEIGSAFAAEKFGLPFVAIACSPGANSLWRSRRDPVHPERILPRWAEWLARTGSGLALLYRLNDAVYGALKALRRKATAPQIPDAIFQLRRRLGLGDALRVRPDFTACMWPEWFAPPQPDWPPETLVAGFPFHPAPVQGSDQGRAREARPIVVTTGSLAASQRPFYERAIEACRSLGREAILVTPHEDDVPRPLPPTVTYLPYARFNELFARASLVIHHGGIGTAAYALAAGIPQVVMPMRGDQFDNGNRLVRLGVAEFLCPRKTTAHQLARDASRLLHSRGVSRRCEYWKSRIDPREGPCRAADCVERLAVRRGMNETIQ
ncbi:MAG: glycosyltransferase [Betaproteobacteria bacterium]